MSRVQMCRILSTNYANSCLNPMESHFIAMKCLLHYLKATIDLVLQLRSTSSLPLQAFSDADSVGCPDDQRSTNGYCIFLNPT